MVSDWTVVSKCALHGLIYVCDLKATIKNTNFKDAKENQVIEKDVTLLANLKWSDTDNFYMNLGCHKGIPHSTKPNGTLEPECRNRPNEMGQQLKIEDNKAQKYKTIEKNQP